jgi:hypothetical protein
VGALAASVAIGDLDGDGRGEVVTTELHTTPGAGTLTVTSNRRGADYESTHYPVRQPWAVVLERMDAGPLLDAVVASGDGCRLGRCFTPGRATVFLNSGGGTLGAYGVYATRGFREATGCAFALDLPRARTVAVGDLNGDGLPDLAVTNCEGSDVTLLLNAGFNRFTDAGSAGSGDAPDAVAAGDVDGDHDVDLAIVFDASSVSIQLNDGRANFTPGENAGLVLRKPFVALRDMNDDGTLDLVLVAQDVSVPSGHADFEVLANDGHGHFTRISSGGFGADRDTHAVALADLDADGDPDLAAANRDAGDVVVFVNDGRGRLARRGSTGLDVAEPAGISAGDIDRDGDNDLAVSDPVTDSVRLLLNDGTGLFTRGASIPAGDEVTGVVLSDLNSDGSPDLAYAQPIAPTWPDENDVVRLGNGSGAFGDPVAYLAGIGARTVYAAQLNNVGGPELLVTDDDEGMVWVHWSGRGGIFLDVDLDEIPDVLELRLGTDPLDPDSDDDGVPDGLDPDLLARLIGGFSKSVFGAPGWQQSLLAHLASVEKDVLKGKRAGAVKGLTSIRTRFDGCAASQGKAPDGDDWIRDCAVQAKLQLPYVVLISNLKGVPLPKEILPPPNPQDNPGK